MATPEQIQQALAALAQAASASAGGQLKPEDLAALFGPQWATLVAMPGGLVALPPDQLQQLGAFETPGAPCTGGAAHTRALTLALHSRPQLPQPSCALYAAPDSNHPPAAQARSAGCCALHGDSAYLQDCPIYLRRLG